MVLVADEDHQSAQTLSSRAAKTLTRIFDLPQIMEERINPALGPLVPVKTQVAAATLLLFYN